MEDTPRSDTHSTRGGGPGKETRTGTAGPASAGTAGPVGKDTAGPARKGAPWGLLFVLVVLAFAAGFLWQFYEATTVRDQLAVAEQQLALERLRVHLGQAAIAAQSGEFEPARRLMSTFFSQLQEESATMTPQVRRVAERFLGMRDDVITGLSRSNPEYAAILYGMLQEFGNALDALPPPAGEPAPGADPGTAAPADDPGTDPGG